MSELTSNEKQAMNMIKANEIENFLCNKEIRIKALRKEIYNMTAEQCVIELIKIKANIETMKTRIERTYKYQQ